MNSRTLLPRITAVAGAGLLGVGVFANQIGLSHGGISWTRILLALVGGGLLSIGLLKRRFLTVYTTVAVVAANTVVLFLCIEMGALLFSRLSVAEVAYQGGDQNVSFFHELVSTEVRREIYVGWKGVPFDGQQLHITENGLRLTPQLNVAESVSSRPVKVFAFGGSTMWGEGASDDETIAAHLQTLLAVSCNYPVQVTNFGQRGWVSTQSLIQLMLELRNGNVPDVVVFYDGYNEVTAAYSTGQIGVPENFEGMTSYGDPIGNAIRSVARGTQTGKLVSSLKPPFQPQLDVESVADDVTKTYMSVLQLVSALGSEYGFEVQFYWQPQLYKDSKTFTDDELALLDHPWLPPLVKDLTDAVYARATLAATAEPRLTDISDCFEGQTEKIYVDPCHILGTGNRVVAESMLRHNLLDAVQKKVQDQLSLTTSL